MRRATAGHNPGVSLFPFLAVLICTMGMMMLMLIIINRPGRAEIGTESAAPAGAREATDAEVQMIRERLAAQLAQMQSAREKSTSALADQRLRLSAVEDNIRNMAGEWQKIKGAAADLDRAGSDKNASRHSLETKAARLRAEVADSKQQVQKAAEKARHQAPWFAIVPYDGPNGTRRRPIYIECGADSITLQPEGIELKDTDFDGPLGPGNPLATVLRAVRDYLAQSNGQGQPSEPYPLLIVRPEGIAAFYNARAAMASWASEFGYELVEQDRKLAYPQADLQLAQVEQTALAEARARYAWYAQNHAARHHREETDRPVYRAAVTGGGIVREGGPSLFGDGSQGSGVGGFGSGTGGSGAGSVGTTNGAPLAVGLAPRGPGQPGSPNGNSTNNISSGGTGTGPYAAGSGAAGDNLPGIFPGNGNGVPGNGNGTGFPGSGNGTGNSPFLGIGGGTGTGPYAAGGIAGGGNVPGGYPGNGNGLAGTGTGFPGNGNGTGTVGPFAPSGGNGSSLAGSPAAFPSGAATVPGGASQVQPGGGPQLNGGQPPGDVALRAGGVANGIPGGSGDGTPDSGMPGSGTPGAAVGGTPGGTPGGDSNGASGGSLGGNPSGPPPAGSDGGPQGAGGVSLNYGDQNAKQRTGGNADFADAQPVVPSGPHPGEYVDSLPPPPPKSKSDDDDAAKKQKSLAEHRGRNWSLPVTAKTSTPVSRPIHIECRGDRLTMLPDESNPDPQVIPLGPRTEESVDKLVAAVWNHTKGWGIAGRKMYWRPVLVLELGPSGEGRFAELQALMADSGLEVTRR